MSETYIVDMDNTICRTLDTDYKNSKPLYERIGKINQLHLDGNEIIINTGRHHKYLQLTLNQLKDWNVRYDSLRMGKPPGIIVDDMAVDITEFFT